jgi:hypothetical protein
VLTFAVMAAAQPGVGGSGASREARRAPEEFFYTLSLDGRPAGSARWWAGAERGGWVIRRETSFGGPLVPSRKLEVSRLEARSGLPFQFTETTEGGGRGQYEATFDRRNGVVTVRQGRDEASIPYVADLHDPLSLVQLLRELDGDVTTLRVPLAGGTVLVTRLPDQVMDTPWGEKVTRVYYLRPGVAVVYIEADGPRRPLRFTQTMSVGVLDAIVSRSGAARSPSVAERAPQAASRQGPQARQPGGRQGPRQGQARPGGERGERGARGGLPERQERQPRAQTERQRPEGGRRQQEAPPPARQEPAPAQAEPAKAGGRRKRRRGRRGGQGQGQS